MCLFFEPFISVTFVTEFQSFLFAVQLNLDSIVLNRLAGQYQLQMRRCVQGNKLKLFQVKLFSFFYFDSVPLTLTQIYCNCSLHRNQENFRTDHHHTRIHQYIISLTKFFLVGRFEGIDQHSVLRDLQILMLLIFFSLWAKSFSESLPHRFPEELKARTKNT